MRKIFILLAVIGAVYGGITVFKNTDKNAFLEFSRERVDKMWSNLESGRLSDQENAIGYWYVGSRTTLNEQIVVGFEEFLAEKGIPDKIRSYEILSTELVDGDDVVSRYVEVQVLVNGSRHALKVMHGSPIEWLG